MKKIVKSKGKPGRPSGDEKEEAIYKAVIKLLAKNGYEGLSIEEVAKQASVNKTSIYRKFPTRDRLIQATLVKLSEEMKSRIELLDPSMGLNTMISVIASFLTSAQGRALFMAVIQSSSKKISDDARSMLLRPGFEDSKIELSLIVGAIIHRIYFENAAVDREWIEKIVKRLNK
jgi:AcrR family transcriptional regulator